MGFSWGVLYLKLVKFWSGTSFDMTQVTWHIPEIVCDDDFGDIDAGSACNTLGYTNGGFYETIDQTNAWSEDEIPFLMDGVQCDSASTNFLSCSSNGWGVEDCSHSENVLLTCFASGKASLTFLK